MKSLKMRVLCSMRKGPLIVIIGLCIIFPLVSYWNNTTNTKQDILPNIVLWWTETAPFSYDETRYCELHMCHFTNNHKMLLEAKAVLFYGSHIKSNEMPLPRQHNQIWALLHEESPRNMPLLSSENILRNFNFTSTFSRHSNFPLTTHHLVEPKHLISQNYLVPIGRKSKLRLLLAPVVFIQSDCSTMSGRDEYVRELMKYIRIDSYGKCLNNRNMSRELNHDYLNHLNSPEMYRFLGRYKFVISYENAVCDDYITEKFWRPLVVGSIPIVFGSPSIRDWEPHENSAIHISNFASPESLAAFLHELDNNDVEYNTYLRHKYNQIEPITNKRLLRELMIRYFPYRGSSILFRDFECAVCRGMLEMPWDAIQMASKNHYNCSIPVEVPRMTSKLKESSAWKNIFETGRCEAEVLSYLLERNKNYSNKVFETLFEAANLRSN